MFNKFGEMDYEELIRTAAAEKAEGDEEALIALAQENGLTQEDAEDYMDGLTDVLCTPSEAAIAKIELEMAELNADGIWGEWKAYLMELCMADEKLCLDVRRKDRHLTELFGRLLKLAFESKRQVDPNICKAAGLDRTVYTGIPTKHQILYTIQQYYRG